MPKFLNKRFIKGFSLIEVLPAMLLFASISAVSIKYLQMDLQIREAMALQDKLEESFRRVSTILQENDKAIICELFSGEETTIINFPEATWFPEDLEDNNWIAWRKAFHGETSLENSTVEYRANGMTGWKWWISCLY